MKTTRLIAIAALCAASIGLSGCISTSVKWKDGEFHRVAVGNKTGVGKLKYNPTTGQFELTGYSNDQTEALAAVAEAVAAGVTKGAK